MLAGVTELQDDSEAKMSVACMSLKLVGGQTIMRFYEELVSGKRTRRFGIF